jgi:2-oxoisovalerate dehydrogenase E2 component (dihydrolipoyl transacylase)
VTIKDFALPDLGEGLTESEIVAWHVAEGDMVTLNQVIADVETAKAMVELPSPQAGRVQKLHVVAGTTVDVGQTIVSFEVLDDIDGPDVAPPNLVGYGAGAESTEQPARRERILASVTAPTPLHAPIGTKTSPPVRALAAHLGVDLASVHATGDGGVITRTDVESAGAGGHALGAPVTSDGETTTPVKGIRKLTAEAVSHSAFTAPHVAVFLTIDVTRTVELLDELRGTAAFLAVRLTFLAAVAKAVCSALTRALEVNSRWNDTEQTITQFARVGLGIAAATPRGLLVPVIHDAHALDLAGLASALGDLTTTAKAGETRPANLAGGTFTITNVGVFGVDTGTPILNNGEAAILAVGAVARRPWEWQGEVALRDVVTLSLSFDHRVLDGEQGSRFLADVGRLLSNPASAFAL